MSDYYTVQVFEPRDSPQWVANLDNLFSLDTSAYAGLSYEESEAVHFDKAEDAASAADMLNVCIGASVSIVTWHHHSGGKQTMVQPELPTGGTT